MLIRNKPAVRKNILFLLSSFPVCFCVILLTAEAVFFFDHKTLYFYKSQLRLTDPHAQVKKTDTQLVVKDFDGSLLLINQEELLRQGTILSANARLSREGGSLTLSSKDGKPAFMEISIPINKSAVFNNKPYSYLISFSAFVSQYESPSLSVSYLAKVSFSPPLCIQPEMLLLTVVPHYLEQDIYFDAAHRERHKEEMMRLRISVDRGKAVFSGMSLVALRQYGLFSSSIYFNGDTERFNSAMGVFLQKINYKKNPKVKRIIFLGGSTIYGGNYSTFEATIPKWFDLKIEPAHPYKYEVFNAGMNGATTLSILEGLGHERKRMVSQDSNRQDDLFSNLKFNYLDLEPDIAVIFPMYNDFFMFRMDNRQQKEFDKLTVNRTSRFFFENFALGYYVYSYLKAGHQRKMLEKPRAEGLEDCIKRYRDNLNLMVKILKSRGVKVYLSALPNPALYRSEPSFSKDKYDFYFQELKKTNEIDEGVIKEVARDNNVRYIDLRSYFRVFPQEMDEYLYTPDYVHLRELGNVVASDTLYAAIAGDLGH